MRQYIILYVLWYIATAILFFPIFMDWIEK
jgi:hypothetical protein